MTLQSDKAAALALLLLAAGAVALTISGGDYSVESAFEGCSGADVRGGDFEARTHGSPKPGYVLAQGGDYSANIGVFSSNETIASAPTTSTSSTSTTITLPADCGLANWTCNLFYDGWNLISMRVTP